MLVLGHGNRAQDKYIKIGWIKLFHIQTINLYQLKKFRITYKLNIEQ